MSISHVRITEHLDVQGEHLRDEVIFLFVLHENRIAILVLGRHDVEGMQHRRAVNKERRGGEMASGADPEIKPVSLLHE